MIRSIWTAGRAVLITACTLALPAFAAGAGWTLVGWNNLGMHCMDANYSVFSILPPYNTIHAQLMDSSGRVVTTGVTITYQAVADPAGSINTTSQGKSNFWEFAQSLFGLAQPLTADVGLTGLAMPGTANQPQPMTFDAANGWFIAEGIPITPYDDGKTKNAYPMMRLVAKNTSGTVLATTDIVLPVSDEMDCRACHASGGSSAARPGSGWVNDPDPDRDYRLNILRLHDDRNGASPNYAGALAAAGYSSTGLFATATGGKPILCASCHASNALGTKGYAGVPQLTVSVHFYHSHVTDPTSGLTLESTDNRSACYRCHPGSTTKCLRGAMGHAVAPDGTMAMQCQSCHGPMSSVGASSRQGWLDEPGCQSCHTGTAVQNNGQVRFTSVFDNSGQPRVAVNQTYATTPNAPAFGVSLYRFSTGHGGLKCEACHGSTHAEYPSSHVNDNVQSLQRQGHVGMLVECAACHGSQPVTVNGGPHGMHPIGQDWVSRHTSAAEGNAAQCQACHGADYRGTVLSYAQSDRTLSAFGTKQLWRGFQVGCYTCHNGPGSESANSNHPPQVSSASASTTNGNPVTITLSASDADHNPLSFRIVSQPGHGTAGLVGVQATYYPDAGFVGTDTFTFAAWDGSTNSNLGTVSVAVTAATCTLNITATAAPTTVVIGQSVTFSASVSSSAGCSGSLAYDWDFGDGTAHSSLASPTHTYTVAGSYTWKLTLSMAGAAVTGTGPMTVLASCTAPAITTQPASQTVASGGTATLSVSASGTAPLTYQWYQGSSGDTGAPISGAMSSTCNTGALAASTSYWVRVSNPCGSADSATAVITIPPSPGTQIYLIPAVAHNHGARGTLWRTDVAMANLTDQPAAITATLATDTVSLVRSATVPPAGALEWRNVLESLFGIDPSTEASGALQIASNQPLFASSRNYNQTDAGTFGQGFPALTPADAVSYGQTGVLLPLRKGVEYRTNIGVANLGTSACMVAVRLFDASGTQVGTTKTLTVAPAHWFQQYDIFADTGAGNQDLAYATIEVQTPGGMVWAYAALVDNGTGDPTTLSVQTR
jgi:hypothetical protein